mmetsp:Transcript_14373/g.61668  ORF Transcript_14373/g.61668 Transcript_14373/m.61668 type:complete len:210 (+) Transcript_14373:291-920(+)
MLFLFPRLRLRREAAPGRETLPCHRDSSFPRSRNSPGTASSTSSPSRTSRARASRSSSLPARATRAPSPTNAPPRFFRDPDHPRTRREAPRGPPRRPPLFSPSPSRKRLKAMERRPCAHTAGASDAESSCSPQSRRAFRHRPPSCRSPRRRRPRRRQLLAPRRDRACASRPRRVARLNRATRSLLATRALSSRDSCRLPSRRATHSSRP